MENRMGTTLSYLIYVCDQVAYAIAVGGHLPHVAAKTAGLQSPEYPDFFFAALN